MRRSGAEKNYPDHSLEKIGIMLIEQSFELVSFVQVLAGSRFRPTTRWIMYDAKGVFLVIASSNLALLVLLVIDVYHTCTFTLLTYHFRRAVIDIVQVDLTVVDQAAAV